MKQKCRNCNQIFYPTENNYVGYPYTCWVDRETPAETRLFHSRGCWEDFVNKNIASFTRLTHEIYNNEERKLTNGS